MHFFRSLWERRFCPRPCGRRLPRCAPSRERCGHAALPASERQHWPTAGARERRRRSPALCATGGSGARPLRCCSTTLPSTARARPAASTHRRTSSTIRVTTSRPWTRSRRSRSFAASSARPTGKTTRCVSCRAPPVVDAPPLLACAPAALRRPWRPRSPLSPAGLRRAHHGQGCRRVRAVLLRLPQVRRQVRRAQGVCRLEVNRDEGVLGRRLVLTGSFDRHTSGRHQAPTTTTLS